MSDKKVEDRSAWRPFIERACEGLGIDANKVDEDLVLDMTRVIARGGARPMAPISAYLVGVAAGRGMDPEEARRLMEAAAAEMRES